MKMIKQQMFGRARFDLLRKRILNQPEHRPMPSMEHVPEPVSVIPTGEDQVETSVDHFGGHDCVEDLSRDMDQGARREDRVRSALAAAAPGGRDLDWER
jgi:hypothetical protein